MMVKLKERQPLKKLADSVKQRRLHAITRCEVRRRQSARRIHEAKPTMVPLSRQMSFLFKSKGKSPSELSKLLKENLTKLTPDFASSPDIKKVYMLVIDFHIYV